jgi:2,4-diketo-3-deoxy-L-fuconate hydrolase
MRFMRIGPAGAERPVVVDDAGVTRDLTPLTADVDPPFLAGGGIAATRAALASGALQPVDVAGERIGAPLASPPSLVCVGMNYAAHAAESGSAPPEHVVVFFKKTNTIVGPHDPILLPTGATQLDWEVELGIVVGADAHRLGSDEEALAAIAGYVLVNDLSERAWQLETSQWSKGKCGPGFSPFGPWLLTADEVPDPQALRLRSWVDGDPRQDSSTADMVFPVARILRDLSQVMAFEPGDVILTGTPEGVALSGRFPYLRAGNRVRMEIDGLGTLEQTVVDEEEVAA